MAGGRWGQGTEERSLRTAKVPARYGKRHIIWLLDMLADTKEKCPTHTEKGTPANVPLEN